MHILLAPFICTPCRHSNSGVGFPEFLSQAFSQRSYGVFGGSVEVQWAVWMRRVAQVATEKLLSIVSSST